TGGAGVFATIPDNACTLYPDNTPDAWLLRKPIDPVPVPRGRIGTLAFGSLWLANTPTEPGLLRWSEPGMWGTFPRTNVMYPDPRGQEITGIAAVPDGLLVFTEMSLFRIEMAE